MGEKNFQKILPKKSKKSIFWPKMAEIEKIFEKNFLIEIDLEWLKTYFKTKISILKIFSH